MALATVVSMAGPVWIARRCSFSPRGVRPVPADQSFHCLRLFTPESVGQSHSFGRTFPAAAFRLRQGGQRSIDGARNNQQHAGFLSSASASLAVEKETGGDTSQPLEFVQTKMKYYRQIRDQPYMYVVPPPQGKPATNLRDDVHQMEIASLRPLKESMKLDRNGFEVVSLKTALENFDDDDEIARVYYPEAAAAIKSVTGASRVHIFDHTIRRRPKEAGRLLTKGEDVSSSARQPVDRVHVDFTEKSGPQRVRDLMGVEAESLLKRRFAIVQLWRPLKGPVIDAPLALVDAATVSPEDLQPVDLIYADRVGEVNYVKHNPRHKWYYLPRMKSDEAFAFKCYESDRSGVARFTPHSAFVDPTTPPDADRRESIEIRSLVFWDE